MYGDKFKHEAYATQDPNVSILLVTVYWSCDYYPGITQYTKYTDILFSFLYCYIFLFIAFQAHSVHS
jgi:hypothetical protein